jgi:prolyl-tRNA editing enzyme YbaK/EbsC (Cys-tRNA(Pro) deacylase)
MTPATDPGADVAQRHSGYEVGVERSIARLASVYINGGRRGFLVKVKSADLLAVLKPKLVDVALEP